MEGKFTKGICAFLSKVFSVLNKMTSLRCQKSGRAARGMSRYGCVETV